MAVAEETLATVPPALDTVPVQLVSLAVLLAVQVVVPVVADVVALARRALLDAPEEPLDEELATPVV